MRVFVLLFNAGTDNEGIHTIKIEERNVILMFEGEEDAVRYGLMLEAQDFMTPTIEAFDAKDIEEFCLEAGYEYKLVPEGALAVPPEKNLDKTDWQAGETTSSGLDERSNQKPEFSQPELDDIRRRLEGLL